MSSALLERAVTFEPKPKKWTNAEFEALIAEGHFQNTRVELIAGEILEMSPMLEPHARGILFTAGALAETFPFREFFIRQQMPFYAGEGYRPEPDILVVRREELSGDAPPSSALLLIEVSDSTLRYDRTEKASLYASVGVSDYWILNLVDHVLEVRRTPRPDSTARFGFSYSSLQTLSAGDRVAPLAMPEAIFAIDDLLG
jgi:Uma2 family endonuclease